MPAPDANSTTSTLSIITTLTESGVAHAFSALTEPNPVSQERALPKPHDPRPTGDTTFAPPCPGGLAFPIASLVRDLPDAPIFVAYASSSLAVETREGPTDIWDDEACLAFLQSGTLPGSTYDDSRRVLRRCEHYRMQGGRLYRVFHHNGTRLREVPKPDDRIALVQRVHADTGHFGRRRTTALLLANYWWVGMKNDVNTVLKHCVPCNQSRATYVKTTPELQPLPIQGLFYRIGVDLAGPYDPTPRGNRYIMVCMEHFSKYAVFVPIPNKEAATTAYAFLHHILGRWGSCAEVCSDGGSEWKGAFGQLLSDCFIDHRQTSPNHPQADGLTERAVQTCKRALDRMCQGRSADVEWDMHLPYVTLGYNCSVQDSTGFSPYEILHGVPPTIPPAIKPRFLAPIDLDDPTAASEHVLARSHDMRRNIAIAGDNLAIAQHRDTRRYAYLRGGGYHPRIRRFEIGDYVYYRNTSKESGSKPPVILRVVEVRPSGVLMLQGYDGLVMSAHCTHCAPCHVPIKDETVDPRLVRPPALLPCQVCSSPDHDGTCCFAIVAGRVGTATALSPH